MQSQFINYCTRKIREEIYTHINAKGNLMARARNTPVVNWSRFPSISFRGLLNQRAYISADVTSVKK